VHYTVFSQIEMQLLEDLEEERGQERGQENRAHAHEADHAQAHYHEDGDHSHDHAHAHAHDSHHHHTHDHVMAYTHFFERAVDSSAFEEFVSKLPQEVYRAKGILSFSDTASRFLFQYA
jgi:G3E family GTPase